MIHRAPRCAHGFYAGWCRAERCPHAERQQAYTTRAPRNVSPRCDRCRQHRNDVKRRGFARHCDECHEELEETRAYRGQGGYSQRAPARHKRGASA